MIRTVFTAATVAATVHAVPWRAHAQTEAPSGTLVVVNKGAATANVIDLASGRTLATLPTGNGPHELVLSGDGRVAVATDYGGRRPGTRSRSSTSPVSWSHGPSTSAGTRGRTASPSCRETASSR